MADGVAPRLLASPGIRLDRDVIFHTPSHDLRGRYLGLDQGNQTFVFWPETAAPGRRELSSIPIGEVLEIRGSSRHPKVGYVILATSIGTALGAIIGFQAGDKGYHGGDVVGKDTRQSLAFAGGLVGISLSFPLALLAGPSTRTEEVLWTR